MIANQSNVSQTVGLVFLNGNQQIIAVGTTELSGEDLDEVNVCHSLVSGGVAPPAAGLIEMVLTDANPIGGVYGWVKDVLGKFFVNVPEPFEGRVSGIGKTECRVAPVSIANPQVIQAKAAAALASGEAVVIPLILIEGTADDL
jgi:hypothetical protein